MATGESDNYTLLLKDTLQLIRAVNRLASIVETVEDFADRICHVLCNKKNYNLVWLALFRDDKFDHFARSYGSGLDVVDDHFDFSTHSLPACINAAKLHRRVVSSRDDDFSCNLCSLNKTTCHDYGVVFPLRYKNEFLGVIGCSISEDSIQYDFAEEKKLFEEVSTDIAFAINKYHIQGLASEVSVSLENMNRIVDNDNDCMIIIQEERIVEVNDILLKICSLERSELLGVHGSNLVDSSLYSRIEIEVEPLRKKMTKKSKAFLIPFQNKFATQFYFDCYFTLITFNNKDAIHVRMVDRTEGIMMEEELSINQKRLNLLMTNFPGMAYLASQEKGWRFDFASDGAYELLGYHVSDLVCEDGVAYRSIVYPDDLARVEQAILLACERNETYDLRYRILHKKGDIRWVWERGQSVNYRGVSYLEGYILDVSESMAYQDHLHHLNDKKQVILDNVPSMICYLDLDGFIVDCNKSLSEILELSISELVGAFYNQFWETGEDKFMEWVETVIEHCSPLRQKMGVMKNRSGKKISVLVDIVPHVLENGDLGVIVFSTDVSDIMRMTNELTRKINELSIANKKAKESDELKSEFLSTLSHEMRTPMNGIIGFASLLKNPRLNSEERDKYTRIIKEASGRMLTTMDNIIEMSKIQTSLVTPEFSAVNLAHVLASLIDNYQQKCTDKGLLLVYDNSMNISNSLIVSDERMLNVILNHLLGNAVRFTKEGSITLSCFDDGTSVWISVKDTGIGITGSKLTAIFETFTHAPHELSENPEGSGLGLSIVKAYIEMLGGSVTVRSERKIGSEFSLQIPKRMENDEVKTASLNSQRSSSIKTILISESDLSSSIYLRYYLESLSFCVLSASSLEETISTLENTPEIGLLILNPHFSKYEGVQILTAVRDVAPLTPLIIQTTSVLEEDKELAARFNYSSFLIKPYAEHELEKAVLTVLRRDLV